MTVIGLVRHGVTDWNLEARAQGHHDIPLNDTGIRQAELLAQRLANEAQQWDLIYASDLVRARVTAKTIARAIGKEVDGYDVRLREKTHGRLDGTTEAERVELWGERWRELDHGEETEEQILARSLHIMEEVSDRHSGKRILLVSHGAWIATTLRRLLGRLPDGTSLQNTSITILRKQQDSWSCELYNCARHLDVF